MSERLILLLVGIFIGSLTTVGVMALMQANRLQEEREDLYEGDDDA